MADDDAGAVRRARSAALAAALSGGAAGLRAAARALRGEDAVQDAGLAPGAPAAPGAPPPPPPRPRPPQIGPEPSDAPAPPAFDVVFIHGVRGGPFVTWRRGDVLAMGGARHSLAHGDCWPAAWLAEDLPGARLLSIEYHAPVTGWEAESLSVPERARAVLDKLVAAGVGQRPVVFVCHSMGGLMVKEMLSLSLDEAASGGPRARLAPAAKGVVFFATPHFGSPLASLGLKLRHVPGAANAPAPAVHHLAPGPHLERLNETLRALHAAGRVDVLSFAEGLPTPLAGFIPRVVVVPYESAFPGFGASRILPAHDHVDLCKPKGRGDPVYTDVLTFARRALGVDPGGGGGSGCTA
ncbi:MAG: hypothetical protein J3K34DRAFT_385248 [Monoraphidium minutum]|nr:MAG: hypothetical protein J3K34DRAFT_385248 [Monoraphidium minutum]